MTITLKLCQTIMALLSTTSLEMTYGTNFFEQNIDHYIVNDKCHEALLNCTTHWSMIPFIPPVGLCEEYFSIECMTELVVSSNCIDEPGYGEFLEQIAIVIEDCAKSGMRWTSVYLKKLISRSMKHILCNRIQKHCYNITTWDPQNGICDKTFPACVMRTYAKEYCREFDDDLELEYYKCLSDATRCSNKREIISICEKEYLTEIKRIIGKIDRRRDLATKKGKKRD